MIRFIKNEVIQKYVWENQKFKQIKGATHTNGSGSVFKIFRGKPYYWHASQGKWERSTVFTVAEVLDMYTTNP